MSYDTRVPQNASEDGFVPLIDYKDVAASQHALEVLVDWQLSVSESDGQAIVPIKANMATYAFALVGEAAEVMQELNWKPWKKHFEPNNERVSDEWADMTAFYLLFTGLVCRATGLTPWDLIRQYFIKSAINVERLNGRVEGYGKETHGTDSA